MKFIFVFLPIVPEIKPIPFFYPGSPIVVLAAPGQSRGRHRRRPKGVQLRIPGIRGRYDIPPSSLRATGLLLHRDQLRQGFGEAELVKVHRHGPGRCRFDGRILGEYRPSEICA